MERMDYSHKLIKGFSGITGGHVKWKK